MVSADSDPSRKTSGGATRVSGYRQARISAARPEVQTPKFANEAMACGLPVLVTTGCNFPELTKEDAGWICEAEHESLFSALRNAVNSSDSDLESMGTNGRQLVESTYTWSQIASTIIQATDGITK